MATTEASRPRSGTAGYRWILERAFGRSKTDWGLVPLRVRRLPRVTLHANLTIMAQLADALTRVNARNVAA